MTYVQQIRKEAGFSLTAAAALAKVSPHTWRSYELAQDAVSKRKRGGCDAAVEQMVAIVAAKRPA
jgi:hypothetical protein